MLKVGLTGGIGSGKSAVARLLVERGAHLVDADLLAREVVAPGTPGLAGLVAAFGAEVLAPDGSLDRGRLAAVAFTDDDSRAILNGVLHPLIAALTLQRYAQAEAAGVDVLVHDVPLLVENGLAARYDVVVVVQAPVEVRLDRLTRLRGMTEADARARMAAQASDEARAAVADVVIDNAGTPEELAAQVDVLWSRLLVRAH